MTSKYLNDEGIRILKDRFLTPEEKKELDKNNDIDKVYWKVVGRIVSFVNNAEKGSTDDRLLWARKFTDIIGNQEFVPGGRFWANAGTSDPQLFNCDVVSPKDDLNDIYDKLKVWGISHSFGAGMGGNFGKIRHRGAPVKGNPNKKACGPVAVIKMHNAEAELNQQSGSRRSACMGILPFIHPDILDFVYNKNEGTDMSHFNQSVSMIDDIMRFLSGDIRASDILNSKNGCDKFKDSTGEYFVYVPNKKKKLSTYSWLKENHKGRVLYKTDYLGGPSPIDEYEGLDYMIVFDAIAENAWRCGDPGMMFIDTVNKANPLIEDVNDTENRWYFDSPNPCIAEGSLISTERGLIPIQEVVVGDKVATHEGFNVVTNIFNKGIKNTVEIQTRYGRTLKCTPDHKILTYKGWKEASSLKKKDKLVLQPDGFSFNLDEIEFEEGFLAGINFGDGSLSEKRLTFCFHPDDIVLAERVQSVLHNNFDCNLSISRITQENSGHDILRMGGGNKKVIEFLTPYQNLNNVVKQSSSFQSGFLQGYFAADGHIEKSNGTIAISLTSIDKDIAIIISNMLLRLGIYSKTFKVPRKGHSSDKKYGFKNKPSYRVQIAGKDKILFQKLIGLAGKHMQDNFRETESYNIQRYDEVASVRKSPSERVYDLTVPGHNSFIANGIAVHNCGEIYMADYEICMLGAINLSKMIKFEKIYNYNGIDPLPSLNKERLKEVTKLAVRFLDDSIDVSSYPTKENKWASQQTRRIGLGIMGFADMLALMNIPYGSDRSYELAERVMKIINETALDASIELGREKGDFPLFEKSAYYDGRNNFPQVSHLRNAFRTSIAPTGTIAALVGVNNGLEPFYALSYKQTDGLGSRDIVIPFLEKYPEYNEEGRNEKLGKATQHVLVTAKELTYEQHIKMQAAFQKYIDNSISKTINLPKSATVEDVKNAYILAWKLGCKGITIYRDGSKTVQVLEEKEEETEWNKAEEEYKNTPAVKDASHKAFEKLSKMPNGIFKEELFNEVEVQVDISKELDKYTKEAVLSEAKWRDSQRKAWEGLVERGIGTITPLKKQHRPEGVLKGETWKIMTGDGNLYVTLNEKDYDLFEVFCNIGNEGSIVSSFTEAIGKLISTSLQHGISPNDIADCLIGIMGPHPFPHPLGEYKQILSVPDAIGKLLKTKLKELKEIEESKLLKKGAGASQKKVDKSFEKKFKYDPEYDFKEQTITEPLFSSDPGEGEVFKGDFTIPYSDLVISPPVVGSTPEICPNCHQEYREVEGCRSCGCGSQCDDGGKY